MKRNMLDFLKSELKNLVGLSQHDEVFRQLKEDVLRSDCALYNDMIIIQSRYTDSKREGTLGTIDFKEKNQQFNNVSQALVWLIDRIAIADLSEACRERWERAQQATPNHLVYTCDRVGQMDYFEKFRDKINPGSQHFFYLFGGELQAHKSLFTRLSLDLQGFYAQNDGAAAAQPILRRSEQVIFTVEDCRDPEVLRERFIRNMFTAFGLTADDYRPLLQQNIGVILDNSSKTKTLTKNDFLCVFVHISHWAWNQKLTPEAALWFIETFCQCTLRTDGPALLFFFALDYDEDMNPGVRDQVVAAVQQGAQVKPLPELDMVERKDVALWLVKNAHLFPLADQRKQILLTKFPDSTYFMEDVEVELRKLIDVHHNKKTQN